jgi:carbon starvation protein CstA
MENKQERLCGRECLGMEPQLFDAEAGNYGNICVPPVMQAQIEILTTVMILLPMKQAVLQRLEKLVMSNDPKAWFTIYLVMFIVLHSCGLLTKAERARCLREALVGSTVCYVPCIYCGGQVADLRLGAILQPSDRKRIPHGR